MLRVLPLFATLLAAVHPMDGPDADVRIQIADERVRVVCALNLAFADAVVDAPRAQPGAVADAEVGALRAALFALLANENTVEIDGVLVRPRDGGFDVLPAAAELVPLFPRFGALALTKVQLVLDYPAKSPPRRVRFRWGPFPPNAALAGAAEAPPIEIDAQLTAEGLDSLVSFRADAPEHTWEASGVRPEDRFLAVPSAARAERRSIPLVSAALALAALALLAAALRPKSGERRRRLVVLGCFALALAGVQARPYARIAVGAPPPPLSPDEARAVFRPLHANIYRAFDYDDESAIYDALARSVEGPLLAELYDQMYRSLLDQEADGARSTVSAVRLQEADVEPSDSAARFDVVARWQVDGSVFHWGHGHARTNEYRARYTVRAGADGWRIAASQVLAERRVDAAPLAPPGAGEPEEPEER
jgi:hypothetical protein